MTREYIYLVYSDFTIGCKVGRWSSDLSKLIRRYVTYYGKNLDITIFQCNDAVKLEYSVKYHFKKSVFSGELFFKEIIPEFYEYVLNYSYDYCDIHYLENNYNHVMNSKPFIKVKPNTFKDILLDNFEESSSKKDFVKLKDIKNLLKENNVKFSKESLHDDILDVFPGSEFCSRKIIKYRDYTNVFMNLKSNI